MFFKLLDAASLCLDRYEQPVTPILKTPGLLDMFVEMDTMVCDDYWSA